jgi:hypothetical protein
LTRPGFQQSDGNARDPRKIVGWAASIRSTAREQFGHFIGSEIGKWSKVAKDVGAKAE